MGGSLSSFDEKKKQRANEQLKDWLSSKGVPIPTESMEKIPDHFNDNAEAVNFWFVANTSGISSKRLGEWMKQPFSIAERDPLSYYQRKRKSILSADNPFPTTKSEAEDMILDKIEQHLPLKKGGRVGRERSRHFFLPTRKPKRIF